MGVMHLWAIIGGVLAVGIPLAVHWLTRPRPRKMSLSTVKFLAQAIKERRSRNRLRDAVILTLRMLAVVLLALAFARPLVHAASETHAAVERVVVIDASASMGAVSHGAAAMERARGVAARYLEDANGLKANLVVAGAKPHGVFEHPSSNLAALREELGNVKVRPERLDLAGALAAAGESFDGPAEKAGGPRREVVIVSDLQRSNWGAADFSVLPQDCHVVVESVAPEQTPANLAIVGVRATGANGGRASAGRPGIADVQVANESGAAQNVGVEVDIDGRTFHFEKTCLAHAVTEVSGEVEFSRQGVNVGEARLTGVADALAADNQRAFVVDVHAAPVYLLVSRESAAPEATSSHFLERGLVPEGGTAAGRSGAAGGSSGEKVVRVNAAGLDPQALAEADAVVLDHPGRLEGQQIALLANWLRRGKSILYVAAEAADANNLGALEIEAGSDLRMPVEFIPMALSATGDAGDAGGGGGGGLRRNLKLAEVRRSDPVWAVFGDGLNQTLDALRFAARLTSKPVAGALADDVLASYDDRSACLVAAPCGAGTLIVWNADLAESNIVRSGAFVPLVGELAARLRAAPRAAANAGGDSLVLAMPADVTTAADLTVIPPAPGQDDAGRFVMNQGELVWRLDEARQAGVYRIVRSSAPGIAPGGAGGQTVAAVAVAIPAEEADLEALPAELLKGRLSGGREITVRAAGVDSGGPDRAWVWLAAGALLALLAEAVCLRAFGT